VLTMLADTTTLEVSARRLAGQMAACLQASLLVRFAPPAIADAFCATRLGGDYNGTLGTLPVGSDLKLIVDRTTPVVA
jgi:putative acyl-CoA dehydrogenase